MDDTSDREILVPVIGSLLQELDFNESSTEQAYRQLIIDIATALGNAHGLSGEVITQLSWLKKLALSGHDISALQALAKTLQANLRTDDQYPADAQDKQAERIEIAEPIEQQAAVAETEMLNAITTSADQQATANKEQTGFDFNHLASGIAEPRPLIYQDPGEPNHFNNQELRSLKNTLQTRLQSTKEQCNEFDGLMQLLLSDLREAKGTSELETTRSMLKSAIKRLLGEHETISGNIMDVANELNRFETHCEQLNHELGMVKRLSLTDELTRLPNRRAFLKRLQNESGRVQRYGYPLSVAILDLDLFKEINDTYGHAIGDEVLQTYTNKVLSTFRNYDLVARYGGEEFAVLLPHTDIYGAERALNKVLLKTVNTHLSSGEQDTEIRLPSFSAGVAVYKEGEPIESVINRADNAMYKAKKMGRNRVVIEAG